MDGMSSRVSETSLSRTARPSEKAGDVDEGGSGRVVKESRDYS